MECRTILGSQDSQSVQSLSRVWLFETPWTAARQASLSITNSWSLLKFMSIEPVMPCNHLILCHPLLLLPSVFPSIRVFSNEFVFMYQVAKYWIFSISPSNEYSGQGWPVMTPSVGLMCRFRCYQLTQLWGFLLPLFLVFSLKHFFFFNLSIAALQHCVIFCRTAKWISYIYTFISSF